MPAASSSRIVRSRPARQRAPPGSLTRATKRRDDRSAAETLDRGASRRRSAIDASSSRAKPHAPSHADSRTSARPTAPAPAASTDRSASRSRWAGTAARSSGPVPPTRTPRRAPPARRAPSHHRRSASPSRARSARSVASPAGSRSSSAPRTPDTSTPVSSRPSPPRSRSRPRSTSRSAFPIRRSAYVCPLSPNTSMLSSIPPGRFQLFSTMPIAPLSNSMIVTASSSPCVRAPCTCVDELRVDALHLLLAEEPPAESDAVAAEVHQRPAARLIDVPEPVGVRARVLLSLLHDVDATERAFVRHLLRLHVLRREEQLLGVEQQHARLRARLDHRVGFLERDAERLLADDVLAGARRVDRDLRVQSVRRGDRRPARSPDRAAARDSRRRTSGCRAASRTPPRCPASATRRRRPRLRRASSSPTPRCNRPGTAIRRSRSSPCSSRGLLTRSERRDRRRRDALERGASALAGSKRVVVAARGEDHVRRAGLQRQVARRRDSDGAEDDGQRIHPRTFPDARDGRRAPRARATPPESGPCCTMYGASVSTRTTRPSTTRVARSRCSRTSSSAEIPRSDAGMQRQNARSQRSASARRTGCGEREEQYDRGEHRLHAHDGWPGFSGMHPTNLPGHHDPPPRLRHPDLRREVGLQREIAHEIEVVRIALPLRLGVDLAQQRLASRHRQRREIAAAFR